MTRQVRILASAGATIGVLLAGLWWTGMTSSATDTPAIDRRPEEPGDVSPIATHTVTPLRELPTATTTMIIVRRSSGAPLPNSDILPWPLPDDTTTAWSHPAVASTDGRGTARLEPDALPESHSLLVRHPGFVPYLLVDVQPGSTHEVTLQLSASCRVSVVDESGAPVEGFSVALSRLDLPPAPACTTAGTVYHGFGGTARQIHPACFGKSDRGGLIVFRDVLPGRNLVSCNFDRRPFFITNWSECLAVEAPGEVRIVTKRLWAAVVKLIGDEVLAAGFEHGPASTLTLTSETENILALRHATSHLEATYPGCRVVVGALMDGAPPSIRMAVCGATSGWKVHHIPLSPLHDAAERSVLIAPGSLDVTARVNVHLIDADSGRIADHAGARAVLGWRIEGVDTFLETEFGVESRIPAGPYDVSASGELPPGCFPPTRRIASPGSLDTVRIPVKGALHRYAIRVRRPDGSGPTHFGLSVSWLDTVRSEEAAPWRGGRPTASMLTVLGDYHSFLSTAPTHACKVYVKGYAPCRVELRAGHGTLVNGADTFTVTLADPVD